MKKANIYRAFSFFSILSLIIVFSLLLVRSVEWWVEQYQNRKHPVKPGMTMFMVRGEEDPFAKRDTTWIKVIRIQDEYVQYEYLDKEYKDTASAKVSYIRYFTPVNSKK